MSRYTLLAAFGLVAAAMLSLHTEEVNAGHRHRAYGYGYYSGYYGGYGYGYPGYATGYRGVSVGYGAYPYSGWGYGSGYGGWATTSRPYYHHGSLYRGGYRPSYSYGLYQSIGYAGPIGYQAGYAPYGYSTMSSGYDYAPYVASPLSTINTAPVYTAPYGAYGYSAVGCGCR